MRWKTDLHGTVACGDNRNNFESFQSLDRNNSHGRLIRWREFSSAETRDIEKWIHNTPRNAFWRKRSREGCFCQTPPDKLCFPLLISNYQIRTSDAWWSRERSSTVPVLCHDSSRGREREKRFWNVIPAWLGPNPTDDMGQRSFSMGTRANPILSHKW
jgi:hypothetical protein